MMTENRQREWPHVTAGSASPVPRRGNIITRTLCKTVLRLSGFKMTGSLPAEPKFIAVMGPHTSNWDFIHGMSVQYALGVRFSFMIKSAVFKPVIGPVIRFLGGIPVDRKAARGVTDAMVERFKRAEKLILVITPEGTRTNKGVLKNGFYRIATQANVPVLVASMNYKTGIINLSKTLPPTLNLAEMTAELDRIFGPVQGRNGTWLGRPLAESGCAEL